MAFEVRTSPLAEPSRKPVTCDCVSWAIAMAYFKARAVAREVRECWILGADTVVDAAGEWLGTPRDRADAARMLALQAGRACAVITGVALLPPAASRRAAHGAAARQLFAARTWVTMRNDPSALSAYIDSGDWAGKAGAYGLQNVHDHLIERMDGSFSNVVGLPQEALVRHLAIAGFGVTGL